MTSHFYGIFFLVFYTRIDCVCKLSAKCNWRKILWSANGFR